MKKFKLNPFYEASFDGVVKYMGVEIPFTGENVLIDFNGLKLNLDRKWFGLICHYETDLPFEQMQNIRFKPCSSKVLRIRCGFIPYFIQPQEFRDGFYIIPGFFDFVINKKGDILSRRFNRVINSRLNPYGYPSTAIYDPDKEYWRQLCTHIALARTFIPNPSYEERPFVNHKDGVKTNLSLRNLEWASGSENNTHAFKSGLRGDNRPCWSRDLTTKEEKHFSSIAELRKFHKLLYEPFSLMEVNGEMRLKPLGGKIEIKFEEKQNWAFEQPLEFKVNIKPPYEARNVKTGEIVVTNSLRYYSDRFNLTPVQIRTLVSSQGTKFSKDWCIRMKTEMP